MVRLTGRAPKGKPERPPQPVIDQQKLNRERGWAKLEILANRREQKEKKRLKEAEAMLHERKKNAAAR